MWEGEIRIYGILGVLNNYPTTCMDKFYLINTESKIQDSTYMLTQNTLIKSRVSYN